MINESTRSSQDVSGGAPSMFMYHSLKNSVLCASFLVAFILVVFGPHLNLPPMSLHPFPRSFAFRHRDGYFLATYVHLSRL